MFDSSYFRVKVILKMMELKIILAWKSKGLSDENIKPPVASDNSLVLPLSYIGVRPRIKFNGQYLKQDKTTLTQNIAIHIIYEINGINLWVHAQGADCTLENSLFGAATQPTITCSKLTIETLEQGRKYVQS